MSAHPHGALVISLDLELYWGLHDQVPLARCRERILGVRRAVPRLLELFEEYEVGATWAVVGLVFFADRPSLIEALPTVRPDYVSPELSPYERLDQVGRDETVDPIHLGGSLVDRIRAASRQEIASHTFSHFYCLEEGQGVEAFRADLDAAVEIARRRGIALSSLVFPRNQANPAYRRVCREMGIRAVRGNADSWIYRARPDAGEHLGRRSVRLLDAYVNLTGHHTHSIDLAGPPPWDVPASRFFRPYSRALRWLEPLKLRRIRRGLDEAAENGRVFHLWWHPHNFGSSLDENVGQLRRLLDHFVVLRDRYGFESLTMRAVSRRARIAAPRSALAVIPEYH